MITQNPTEELADLLRHTGPVPSVRVSSARAKGRAKQYPYWGAVRYQIELGRDGLPHNRALERARSDRRTRKGAIRDARALAEEERRVHLQAIGCLTRYDCADVLSQIALPDPLTRLTRLTR